MSKNFIIGGSAKLDPVLKTDKGYKMISVEMENTNGVHGSKSSPLISAAKSGNLDKLKEWLDKGENIETVGENGRTPLHLTALNDDDEKAIECTQELITRIMLNFKSDKLIELLNKDDEINQSPLFCAVTKGNSKLVKILLSKGAKVGYTVLDQTLFHMLAQLDEHDRAIACANEILKYFENDKMKLKEYLDSERRYRKLTALHLAATKGNHELVRILITNGADPAKVDNYSRNIFHHVAGIPNEKKALECLENLMSDNFVANWAEMRKSLLETFDGTESSKAKKLPIHLVAERGLYEALPLMKEFYLHQQQLTKNTVLHSAASLGNSEEAGDSVQKILETIDKNNMKKLLNTQNVFGETALYLSAKCKNLKACQLLLKAGSAFDIKTERGETPLEKVYSNIPQAMSVLLEEAVQNSGYVSLQIGDIKKDIEIDFGPILGYSTLRTNIYKETEELGKVCYADFDDRKGILNHLFIRIYIFEKWEKMKWFFRVFRVAHILWFLFNFFFVVSIYRVNCPIQGALNFTWTKLRPLEEDKGLNTTKELKDCEMTPLLRLGGILNICALIIYFLCQFHQTKQKFHLLFRPMKPFKKEYNVIHKILITLWYYGVMFYNILPCWPIFLGIGILISTLPTVKIVLLDDMIQYIIAGFMGLLVWFAIYLEFGKFPRLRVYINLLMRSTKTLLVAIGVTAPILFGFATIFVILIPGERSFSSAVQSFVKVFTFMIGELDYQNLFYGENNEEKNNVFLGFVMLALAVFIVIIVLLLVNFLIGLAAEEIREFSEKAEIWKLSTQLQEIVSLESFLDETITFCGRDFLRRNLMLMPPKREDGKIVMQRRRAFIRINYLPKQLQKELYAIKFRTIEPSV